MHGSHLVNHIHHPNLVNDSTLHVIGVCSNPVRYHSRYRIAREWIKHLEQTPNVKLYVVEASFGQRHAEIIDPSNPNHLHLKTSSEIWIKENMINLGVRHLLPKDWKYLAWVDMDIFFEDPNWALETIHRLQHYHVIQPWQDCIDLGPNGTVLETHKSFAYLVNKGLPRKKKPQDPYFFGHPGFAWACDRYFWENSRGLIDFAILGSADHHMACAMINEASSSTNEMMVEGFKQGILDWEKKVYRVTSGHMGYVPTLIKHSFHGPKKRRYYIDRWKILIAHQFNPKTDLAYDSQGMIQLVGKPKLEEAIRKYNRSRCEDSIEEF